MAHEEAEHGLLAMQQIIEKAFFPLLALNLLIHSQPDASKWGCRNEGSEQYDELGKLLSDSVLPSGSLANLGIAPQGINLCMYVCES